MSVVNFEEDAVFVAELGDAGRTEILSAPACVRGEDQERERQIAHREILS